MDDKLSSRDATRATFSSYLGIITVPKYKPLPPRHPYIGLKCFFCGEKIREGDETCGVPVRPASLADWVRMTQGDTYHLRSEMAHWDCVAEFAEKRGF